MKRSAALVITSGLVAAGIVGAPPVLAGELTSDGVTISWDDSTFYEPRGCSQFLFNWTNGSGRDLLEIEMNILSRFGDKVGDAGVINAQPGVSGVESMQICSHQLTDGLGPYTMQLFVDQWSSSGIPDSQVTTPITFLSRTPAPAVTPETTAPQAQAVAKPKSVKCISKKTFKKKTFKGKKKCPSGWVKI